MNIILQCKEQKYYFNTSKQCHVQFIKKIIKQFIFSIFLNNKLFLVRSVLYARNSSYSINGEILPTAFTHWFANNLIKTTQVV